MRYAPERHWSSSKRTTRVYDEMWSGNWWWRMQVSLQYLIRDRNGTIVPLIIASDKTTLSTMAGGQQAYLVYITIGNISKEIQRKASKRATVILGYLPVDSFKDVTEKSLRTTLRGELLHRSMEAIIEPLKVASRDGVPMWCADNRLRWVYPILAAFVGDWPEQNDVSCTVRSGCPICQQVFHGRGSGKSDACLRNQADTVAAFRAYAKSNNKAELRQLNLKPWKPFWVDLPHVDFPSCITPDILHQMHKGVFKSYVVAWAEEILGEDVLNERFMAMPQAKNLRHFKNGITNVQQWTGRETKEMAKQYLPIIAGNPAVPTDFVKLVRPLFDFLYLAERAQLAEGELEEMDKALRTFHSLKNVLVELEIMADVNKFDHIPKFHMLGHYTHSIRELGTPDGYNTEAPEHLHIVYAKRGWRASNRRKAIRQIIRYVQRLEAIRIHRAYMDEYFGESSHRRVEMDVVDDAGDVGDGDDDDDNVSDEEDDDDGDLDNETMEIEAVEEELEIGAYPRPTLSVAVHPTLRRLTGYQLIDTYGATDLIPSLTQFLKPFPREAGLKPVVFPSDTFDVWHKLTLDHQPVPFAPNEPSHQDVIRIRPSDNDEYGRQAPGLFDTAIFLYRPQAVGLSRYRAGRVRALFTLPPRLQSTYSGRLAYVELFTRFTAPDSLAHGMHTVSQDLKDGQRRGMIIPVEQLAMACHLAPRFSQIDTNVRLHSRVDTLSLCRNFYLNPFYNSFSYSFFRYWSRMVHV
ncbi:hypothetical protein BDV93DRAFT_479616 [Ceratobasidium sp. AG-I]|nr:hypothetical protein BDV93DRAFT_479616 [Ceratobasidium sp. AG-I]